MLLKTFRLEIVNNHCMPGAMSVNGIARLDQDVGCALPFLNSVLGALEYIKEPPTATFRTQGRLIAVRANMITVNAVQDREQAEKIIDWVRREINDAWKNRENITPRFKGIDRPQAVEILKHLPRTNCGQCRQPTCLVFSLRLAEGAKSSDDCPPLDGESKAALDEYLSKFIFED